jgi:hypothetical protein
VTEAEWLAGEEPVQMLDHLNGKVSDRRLRLFAVACCYVSRRGPPPADRTESYEAVVNFVDGVGTREEMCRQWQSNVDDTSEQTWPERPFEWAREFFIPETFLFQGPTGFIEEPPVSPHELLALLRDIFGNPFRPVAFDPAWRTDTAVVLARQMYEAREFSAMPILADALQDAGCYNDDVLNHCRDATAQHVRGCWVVDLVLGKE